MRLGGCANIALRTGMNLNRWNVEFHKRANLRLLDPSLRLAHDPYFVLSRRHVDAMHLFYTKQKDVYQMVCDGGLANESVFAVALQNMSLLDSSCIINTESTVVDWSRRSSPTSPYVFHEGSKADVDFIRRSLEKNKWGLFLRKVHRDFPDASL